MSDIYEFTLPDRNGEQHRYTVTPFGLDGAELVVEVRAMALEPLGRVLESLGSLDGVLSNVTMDTDLGELFRRVVPNVPWAEVAGDVRTALMQAGGFALVRRLLGKTRRDDQLLSDDRVFSRAYQRNWNEMFVAAFRVAEWNDLLGFTFTSTDSNESAGPAVGVGTLSSNGQLDGRT